MTSTDKLMGIPFKMLKMSDSRTGLLPSQIAAWQATHPDTTYDTVPTAQEVADTKPFIDLGVDKKDDEDDSTADNVISPEDLTEEARLRRLLASWCKAVLEYFCQGSYAKK